MTSQIHYERLASGPGFRKLRVVITIEFNPDDPEQSAEKVFTLAKDFVDREIIKVSEPHTRGACYNHLKGAFGNCPEEPKGPF